MFNPMLNFKNYTCFAEMFGFIFHIRSRSHMNSNIWPAPKGASFFFRKRFLSENVYEKICEWRDQPIAT